MCKLMNTIDDLNLSEHYKEIIQRLKYDPDRKNEVSDQRKTPTK